MENDFMNGDTGKLPGDYYYIYDSKGRKFYYSRVTGKQIFKRNIPEPFHDKIQPKDVDSNIDELLKLKNGYQLEIEKMQAQINNIDIKIAQANTHLPENELKRRQEQSQKDKAKKEEHERNKAKAEKYVRERQEYLRRLFEESSNRPNLEEFMKNFSEDLTYLLLNQNWFLKMISYRS